MSGLYLRLKKRFQGQRGFTIIEMMVVVALIGFLSAISVSLITLLFQSNIRAAQSANQQNSIEVFYGFLASKLSYVNASDMGIPVAGANGEVKADSLAPDQMLFTYVDDFDGQTCYRVMYIEKTDSIRIASYPASCTSSDNPLQPKRRPNEEVTGDKIAGDFAAPGNPLFDPALDSQSSEWNSIPNLTGDQQQVRAYTIASGVRDGSAYGSNENDWPLSYPNDRTKYPLAPLSLFSYLDSGGDRLLPSGGTLNISGSDPLNAILVQSFTSASTDPGQNAIVEDRFYEQKFFIGQLCPLASTGSGGSTAPTSTVPGLNDLPEMPGRDFSIAPTANGEAAVFSAGDFNNSAGDSALSLGSQDKAINVVKQGVYAVSVNLCFADNADNDGAFEVKRGGETIIQAAGNFEGIPEPTAGDNTRCLSATRILSLQGGSTNALSVIPTEGSASAGNISLIWQSKTS